MFEGTMDPPFFIRRSMWRIQWNLQLICQIIDSSLQKGDIWFASLVEIDDSTDTAHSLNAGRRWHHVAKSRSHRIDHRILAIRSMAVVWVKGLCFDSPRSSSAVSLGLKEDVSFINHLNFTSLVLTGQGKLFEQATGVPIGFPSAPEIAIIALHATLK